MEMVRGLGANSTALVIPSGKALALLWINCSELDNWV